MKPSTRYLTLVPLFWLIASCSSPAEQAPADIDSVKPGTVFRDCVACPEMVTISPGSFTMGSPDSEQGRDTDEEPQHRVEIPRAFAVGRFEVTREQFSDFISDSGYASQGGNCWYWNEQERNAKNDDPQRNWRDVGFAQQHNHPVVCISWRDAKAYTVWLSKKTRKQYRLLTEAEWEYAARAGSATARFWGPDTHDSCYYANVGDLVFTRSVLSRQSGPKVAANAYHQCEDGYPYTSPVGQFRPNQFGLHDMMGNVLEWVEDCWNDSYDEAPSDSSAWLTGDCLRRVARGGGWSDIPSFVRSANRDGKAPGLRMLNLGFRVARP